MNFNILDFLWYLIKLFGMSAAVLILMQMIVVAINGIIDTFKKRKRENAIDKIIEQAIKSGNIDFEIPKETVKKKTKK